MNPYNVTLDFAACHIGARFTGEALTQLNYLPLDTPLTPHLDQRAKHLANELGHYSHHSEHIFDLLFVPRGTPFQLGVWRALLAVPAGKTFTYGALAAQLNTAPRAIGQACAANPLPLIIPCHRVVSAQGLGGFMHALSGAPLDIKAWLLRHEKGNLGLDSRLTTPQPSRLWTRGQG